ncbi:hypothetical protein FBU30_011241 [Linnemannia zychae]|nr:hypothetical protein FBU30_011241 [Linnemannia zychae]
MSAPLHIVFEKRLSNKQPPMPSPSLQPQSILIKDQSYFPPVSSSSPSVLSATGGLFARRGSDCSVTSTGSSGSHDCFQCGLHTSNDSSDDESNRRRGLSRSASESSAGSCESLTTSTTPANSNGGSRRLRVQWVDRI